MLQRWKIIGAIGLLLGFAMTGCGKNRPAIEGSVLDDERLKGHVTLLPQSQRSVGMVDGERVFLDDLKPLMLEASGGQVLGEWVLDQAIRRRLAQRGWSIGSADTEQEKALLISTLDDDPNQAYRLLAKLRERRGLGEHRFKQLLTRNAGLRKLVQDEVAVSDVAIERAYQLAHGPRYEARLIVTEMLQEAADLVRRAQAGESFIDLAIAHSTDPSRSQGGLLDPISRVDPTYPQAIRLALARMQPGQVSQPVVLEQGYAVLSLERIIEPSGVPIDRVREQMTQRVRRDVEKMLMERLARTLLSEADVVILDPVLHRSWESRRRRLQKNRE